MAVPAGAQGGGGSGGGGRYDPCDNCALGCAASTLWRGRGHCPKCVDEFGPGGRQPYKRLREAEAAATEEESSSDESEDEAEEAEEQAEGEEAVAGVPAAAAAAGAAAADAADSSDESVLSDSDASSDSAAPLWSDDEEEELLAAPAAAESEEEDDAAAAPAPAAAVLPLHLLRPLGSRRQLWRASFSRARTRRRPGRTAATWQSAPVPQRRWRSTPDACTSPSSRIASPTPPLWSSF